MKQTNWKAIIGAVLIYGGLTSFFFILQEHGLHSFSSSSKNYVWSCAALIIAGIYILHKGVKSKRA